MPNITGDQIASNEIFTRHIADNTLVPRHFSRSCVKSDAIGVGEVIVDHLASTLEARILPAPTLLGSNWREALEFTRSQPSRNNPFVTMNDVKLRNNFFLPPVDEVVANDDPTGSVRLELNTGRMFYVPRKTKNIIRPEYIPVRFSHAAAADLESLDDHRHVTLEQLKLVDSWARSNVSESIDKSSVIQRFNWRAASNALAMFSDEFEITFDSTVNEIETFPIDSQAIGLRYDYGLPDLKSAIASRTLKGSELLDSNYVDNDGDFVIPFKLELRPYKSPFQMSQARGTFGENVSNSTDPVDTLFANEGISLNHGLIKLQDRGAYVTNMTDVSLGGTVYRPGNIAVRGMRLIGEGLDDPLQVEGIEFGSTKNQITWKVKSPATVGEKRDHDLPDVVVNSLDVSTEAVTLAPVTRGRLLSQIHVPEKPTRTWVFQDGAGSSWIVSLIKKSCYIWFVERDSGQVHTVTIQTDPNADPFVSRLWKDLDVVLVTHKNADDNLKAHLIFLGQDVDDLPRMYMTLPLELGVGDSSINDVITMVELSDALRERFYTLTSRALTLVDNPRLVRSSRQRWAGTPQTGIAFKNRNELFLGALDWTQSSQNITPSIALKRIEGPARACGAFDVDGLDDNGFVVLAEVLPQRHISVAAVRFSDTSPSSLTVTDYWLSGNIISTSESPLVKLQIVTSQPYRKTSDVNAQIGTAYNRFVHALVVQRNGLVRDVTLRLSGTTAETGGDLTNHFSIIGDRLIANGVTKVNARVGGSSSHLVFTSSSGIQRWMQTSWLTRQAISPATNVISDDPWSEPYTWESTDEVVAMDALPVLVSSSGILPAFKLPTGALGVQLVEAVPAGEKNAYILYLKQLETVGELESMFRVFTYGTSQANATAWIGTHLIPLVERESGYEHLVIAGGSSLNGDHLTSRGYMNQLALTQFTELTSGKVFETTLSSLPTSTGSDALLPITASYGSIATLSDSYNNFWVFIFGGLTEGRPYEANLRSDWIQKLFISKLTSTPGTSLTMVSADAELLSSRITGGYGCATVLHNVNGTWVLFIINPEGQVFQAAPSLLTHANGLTDAKDAPTADQFVELSTEQGTTRNTAPSSYLSAVSSAQWGGNGIIRYPSTDPGEGPYLSWVVYVESGADFKQTEVKILAINTSDASPNLSLASQIRWHTASRTIDSSSPGPRVEGQLACLGSLTATNTLKIDADADGEGAVFLLQGGREVNSNKILDDQWILEVWRNHSAGDGENSFKHRWTRVNSSLGLCGMGPVCGAGVSSLPMKLDRGSASAISTARVFTIGGSSSDVNPEARPSFLGVHEWPNAWNTTTLQVRPTIMQGQGPFPTQLGSSMIVGPLDVTDWTAVKFTIAADYPAETKMFWMINTDPISDAWKRWWYSTSLVGNELVWSGVWQDNDQSQTIHSNALFTSGTQLSIAADEEWDDNIVPFATDWLVRGANSWDADENNLWIMFGFQTNSPVYTPALKNISIQYKVAGENVVHTVPETVVFSPRNRQGAVVWVPQDDTSDRFTRVQISTLGVRRS